MNRLTILIWSLLLPSVCATIKTLVTSSTAIASHIKNAKYQESSPSSGILSTVAGYKTLDQGSEADASSDNKIYKVTASSGIITTVAGTGVAGYSGDGGQATSATLKKPQAVALDTTGNIYVADTGSSRIRKVTVSTGVITTVAGNGAFLPTNNVAATSTT
jgi:NHL repeat